MESIEKLRSRTLSSCEPWPNIRKVINSSLDEIEREIAEKCIPAPVDADGIVWKHDDDRFLDKYGNEHSLDCMKMK